MSNIYSGLKSFNDYQKANEEFMLKKQLLQAQAAHAMAQASAPIGGATPAVIQVNNAIQAALDKGDTATANRLAWLQRSSAYGVDTFPQAQPIGNAPTQPPVNSAPQMPTTNTDFNNTNSATPAEKAADLVPTIPDSSFNTPARVNPIAAQIANNAATKKAAETQRVKDIELNMNPQIKKAESRAGEVGKRLGEAESELGQRTAVMPQLMQTVNTLNDLGKKATYSIAGKFYDSSGRQFDQEPTEGAIAREEYISLVDNQILPLLRQTFGAQFTATEGESLKSTLGNPNLRPAEKQAVLRSFIDQKMQTVNTLERELGQPISDWSSFRSQLGDFYKPQGNSYEDGKAKFDNKKAIKAMSNEELLKMLEQ